MAAEPPRTATTTATHATAKTQVKRPRSIFDVPANFFDSCELLQSSSLSTVSTSETSTYNSAVETLDDSEPERNEENRSQNAVGAPRWTCNTCKAEFDSLEDQRAHFKSDIHRFNVKLSVAGKSIVKEEDFDELTSDSFKDYDVSSISGSEEDEPEKGFGSLRLSRASASIRQQKLFIYLQTGEGVSVSKCLITNESGPESTLSCEEVIERLKTLVHEPRDKTHLRIVLLASGGHFAGCVFDGNLIVAHKTFHRYVVRAKAGKKQSSKDASGRAAHSAGASLRRHNELALKKEIHELLAAWKPYFDASSCVFVSAPSSNHQLLFNGEKPIFSHQHCLVQNVPMTVRRPTYKEARRIYEQLTQVAYEVDVNEAPSSSKEDPPYSSGIDRNIIPRMEKVDIVDSSDCMEKNEAFPNYGKSIELPISSDSDGEEICSSTPLHEAAQSGDTLKVLELLEQGLDPCIKDERGQTPYMLASEKEVRNTFRRFMASNPDKWDWHAAKVPSALTKEMEESQAAKQAEKDAKKKARAKELKKLRKEKEKKAQAQAAVTQNASTDLRNQVSSTSSILKGKPQSSSGSQISKEEELKRAQAAEREKRAAAAERRRAAAEALSAQGNSTAAAPSTAQPKSGVAGEINCSCCNASLAGKVPFHRYNYKYCSTSCMHVHREILEDG
ncbi:ankyrin repeat and zinc finger domain-containing protein 1 isoform X1 [Prunus avium]|uniref:Ankyrin repeat and zinc finger domain-containing protein 1 isoform X1 n=1 Tax=Prunus avium TaxID=42229 RepID=A0A6P5TFW6_PRUAV|nr:ankyrin repeat and zinc finger domain-containing protein 1 isoform X1 [Prunus avium]